MTLKEREISQNQPWLEAVCVFMCSCVFVNVPFSWFSASFIWKHLQSHHPLHRCLVLKDGYNTILPLGGVAPSWWLERIQERKWLNSYITCESFSICSLILMWDPNADEFLKESSVFLNLKMSLVQFKALRVFLFSSQ